MTGSFCERCRKVPARRKERFCKDCRKAVLKELRETSYLTPNCFGHGYRSSEKREDVRETKRGIDR